jgi:hypothetical protein
LIKPEQGLSINPTRKFWTRVRGIKALPPPAYLRWMTLRRFERERDLLRGHPSDYFSLTGGSHTSVIDIKGVKIKP